MVAAETAPPMESPTSAPSSRPFPRPRSPVRARTGLQRLILSLFRLGRIEAQLLVLRTKLTLVHVAVAAGIGILGLLFAVLGLTFLYIGAFKALELVVSPMWAFLIYGFFHVLVAIALVLYARHVFMLPTGTSDEKTEGAT